MKIRYIIVGLIFNCLITTASYANFNFFYKIFEQDPCNQVIGKWKGTGTLQSSMITCKYTGTADASLKQESTYRVSISLKKQSGSIGCPPNTDLTVDATCDNKTGLVILKDDYMNLSGTLEAGGNSLTLDGPINIPVVNKSANAHIELSKIE